jgi:hypothetical protein
VSLSSVDLTNQNRLKQELQDDTKASNFENLVAALLGRLLGVPIAVAKSGFQHGGDAGPAGRQDRRFRLECKKYSDTTSLSDRELLGEIDHALSRDDGLEAWILAATRNVSEQLAQDLNSKGERIGVPVVILDWKAHEIAPLAALCAYDPDLVEREFSIAAGTFARTLQTVSRGTIATLQRELESWCLGFNGLRIRSHEKLYKIWNSPRASNAELGQDAAGGAQTKKIKRTTVHNALNVWWNGSAQNDAPAAVIGWNGVGKTWAVLDWLIDSKDEQPITLIVPSSAMAYPSSAAETGVKRFLADQLYELTGVRNQEHWLRRLEYLLKRPAGEGPVLTVFFDGMNQESSVSWLSILKVLQGEVFARRVRVLVSTRTYHFEGKLSKLRSLIVPPLLVNVERYDASPGGELDQMLALEGLTQADLHSDLIELARTPRLFKLVVQFRERLVEAGQVTIHRLLWEYGRDTFGERAGKSFSEAEWQAWLKEIAGRYREGVREFSLKSLSETASRPDLTEREVYARLSDIIDGQFAKPNPSGNLQLTPTVVAHALGAALLTHLDAIAQPTFENVESELTLWLDPIGGLDERAEILRAAVSILVERGSPTSTPVAGVLVTAWLQSQNLTDNHRHELTSLAPNLTDALLDAVERSCGTTHASARLWAVNALRAIPSSNNPPLTVIVTRLRVWFGTVALGLGTSAEHDKHRRDRFISRIGTDAPGPITVLGANIKITDRAEHVLAAMGPAILDGFPLANAKSVFEAAAIALAVAGHADGWDGFKWLCLLNEVDPGETAAALRDLSKEIRLRSPESGVHPDLPGRVAALLLWLSGQEEDEDAAPSIDPGIDRLFSYENDYLPRPGRSLYTLERQHAIAALTDTELPLHFRVGRTKELWFDPTFDPPASFVAEVREAAAGVDVEKLYRSNSHTIEDHNFEELEPILARCAPDLLAQLTCKRLQNAVTCPAEFRYWMAIRTTDDMLLASDAEGAAAKTLRLKYTLPDENHEAYVVNKLLMLEIRDVDAQAQFNALICADLKFILTDEFCKVLRRPTQADVDVLITRYGAGSPKQQRDLLILLSIHPILFSDSAWLWIEAFSTHADELRGLAFQTLTRSDADRFGRKLAVEGWCWSLDADLWVNHYGTGALIEATLGIPFDQVAPRLAPWRLLEAVRLRGADPNEVRMAAGIFGHVLAAEMIEEPDPGSALLVDRTEVKASPGLFSVIVAPRPSPEEADDRVAALNMAMDAEARLEARRRAVETAVARINEAWKSGASLYLTEMKARDFEPVLRHAAGMVDLWVEGFSDLTEAFRRRVHLAEAAFLALCEALLAHDPVRGTQLWHALRATVTTRYIGAAGVEDILLMVFRAPDSLEVNTLREELVRLEHCNADQALFDLAIAASFNGKTDWLTTVIEADRAAAIVWRRRRGAVLSGFTVNNRLPVAGAWPEGQIRTSYADLDRKSARFRWIEACARHWWQIYLAAREPIEAYAAWTLFLRSADRRAWIWMREDVQAAKDTSEFFNLKLSHEKLNRWKLKRAMEKRAENFDKNFLDRRTVDGIGPWGKGPSA